VAFAALIVCVVPAFLGETHFAFLGYSLSLCKRLRGVKWNICECSGQQGSAKELKLWHQSVSGRALHELAMRLHGETARLARKRFLLVAFNVARYAGLLRHLRHVIYQTVPEFSPSAC
jgi:ATP-binding cassette subfamily B protein